MVPQPPHEWDAYRTLNIMDRDSGGTTCMGNTRYGKRCRWDIEGSKFDKICDILEEMESRPPNENIEELESLARLCLCLQYHQNQVYEVVDKWEAAIEDATKEYDMGTGLKKQNRELEKKLAQEKKMKDGLEKDLADLQRTVEKKSSKDSSFLIGELGNLRNQLEYAKEISNSALEKLEEETRKYQNEKKEREILTGLVSSLSKDLQKEQKRSKEYRSDLLLKDELSQHMITLEDQLKKQVQDKSNITQKVAELEEGHDKLKNEKAAIQLQLDDAWYKNRSVTAELEEKVKTSQDIISIEVEHLRRKWEAEHDARETLREQLTETKDMLSKTTLSLNEERQTNGKLSVESDQSKGRYNQLSIEAEELRVKLATEQNTNMELRQQLAVASNNLSSTTATLTETQTSLTKIQGTNNELKIAIAERERINLAVIVELRDQLNFLKAYPFKTFFAGLADMIKGWRWRWPKWGVGLRWMRKGGSERKYPDEVDEEAGVRLEMQPVETER